MSNKAVFLDRDGVINREKGEYTYSVEDFELLPGVIEAVAGFKDKGYMVIVITNQGGISKGIYAHGDVTKVHEHMCQLLNSGGARLDDIYYCPHHDINEKCLCRKPGSLMLEKAIARYQIDPGSSFMIGDKSRDIEAAENVGIEGVLIKENSDLTDILHFIS